MSDHPSLTEDQKGRMTMLMRAITEDPESIALMSVLLDGEPRAAIVRTYEDEGQEYIGIMPLAVILTDDMFDRLTPPDDEFEGGVAPREVEVNHEGGTISVGVDDDEL